MGCQRGHNRCRSAQIALMQLSANVNRSEALKFLGYKNQDLKGLSERLDQMAQMCERELKPNGTYCIVSRSNAFKFLSGDDIERHLLDCDSVVLMAVTLGAESEMMLRREMTLNATDGLLLDACASSYVEQAANALNDLIIEKTCENGVSATSRFSPGYGDLSLSCQSDLIRASGADKVLGISVTESDLLIPAKSITAIIGLTRIGSADSPDYPNAGVSDNMGSDSQKSDSTTHARCFNCALKGTCDLRAEGRTCYGD